MDTVFPDIPLYRGWGAPLRLVQGQDGEGMAHGRKLLALKEDSLPIELDAETLETRGEWRCGFRSPLSAWAGT